MQAMQVYLGSKTERPSKQACSNCFPISFLPQPDIRNLSAKQVISRNQEFLFSIASSISHQNGQFTNHESLPSLLESVSCFAQSCPEYLKTSLADQIRSQEYYNLSISKRVCLDYIGNGLYSYSQREIISQQASTSSTPPPPPPPDSEVQFFNIVYRSVNLKSQLLYGTNTGGQELEFEASMRRRIMRYMNLSEDDYSMVFTANQASAFKVLGESYPFESHKNLITVYDHRNESVEAMVESCKKKKAETMSAEFCWPSLRINSTKLRKVILNKGKKKKKNRGLFVFPLQSRISGTRYSYLWMNLAQENGWHVLLDADGLGAKPMDTVGLSIFKPDFLICSFFKVFGENPSGFSCLFVKISSISLLSKSPRGIGIVSLVVPTMSRQSTFAEIETEDEEKSATPPLMKLRLRSFGEMLKEEIQLEETHKNSGKMEKQLSFLELGNLNQPAGSGRSESQPETKEAECKGLDHADQISLILISSRARYQVNWLINALITLKHPHSETGVPLIRIYGQKLRFNRGSAVAFNVFDWKGEKIDPTLVQKLADRNNISVACGFLQNIWLSDTCNEQELMSEKQRKQKGKIGSVIGFEISVVTASIGFLTNFEDLYRMWAFVSRFLDADFVEKERWRYKALNQTTVEV